MTVLLTGAAGFIGFHVAAALLARGERVIGIDNVNGYYDIHLKETRLASLQKSKGFNFHKADISDRETIFSLFDSNPDIDVVIHLAAQAGVRYSLINPFAYVTANVMGHTVMMEGARKLSGLKHFVYASSSSVYGSNSNFPFSVEDRVESPNSLYAATKRSDELIAYTYSHLYKMPATGLRFFTVYGPWGRPDMAAYIFAAKIMAGEPIPVFNHGEMWRDFTYVDDIVAGILAVVERPSADPVPHRVYNLGNHRCEKLTDFIGLIEDALGKKAVMQFEPIQPGDVPKTYADIGASQRDFGFDPKVPIEVGVPRFISWFRDYHNFG